MTGMLVALLLASAGSSLSPPAAHDSAEVAVVFEGRTPCGPVAAEFTGFPSQDCEKIKWRLTLYKNGDNHQPTRYLFKGTRTTREGRWTIRRAEVQAARTTYRFEYDRGKALSLLAVDDRVLLLLDEELDVLVGNASWSYVLNRTAPPSD